MERQELESWLDDWDLPLGPFKSVEEVFADMEARARTLGPSAAPDLARFAAQLARSRHPRLRVLSLFLQQYAELNPKPFAAALLHELTAEGPPLLLDLLGSTGEREALPRMMEILDTDRADEDLLIALAGALGDLGGAEGVRLLKNLQARPGLPAAVQEEIAIALERQ